MILWVFIKIFGVKIVITDIYRYFTDIYRYFTDILPIFTDILPIFFQKFLHKCACSTVAIFRWKNRFFPIFRRKIGDFTDFSPIFPLIDFSSDFSSRCRPKTDFSAKISAEKTDFLFPDPNYLFDDFGFREKTLTLCKDYFDWL